MNTPDESKSQVRPLTTTSYARAVDARAPRPLDVRPDTQMRMSLHYMWPRAESNVYAEPKRLVAAGLATSREECDGEPAPHVYSITEPGGRRSAMARAAELPASATSRRRLLKVLLRENGTREDLLATIRGIREEPRRASLPAVRRRLRGRRRPVSRSVRPERARRPPARRAAGGYRTLGPLGRAGRNRVGRPLPSGRRVGSRDDPGGRERRSRPRERRSALQRSHDCATACQSAA